MLCRFTSTYSFIKTSRLVSVSSSVSQWCNYNWYSRVIKNLNSFGRTSCKDNHHRIDHGATCSCYTMCADPLFSVWKSTHAIKRYNVQGNGTRVPPWSSNESYWSPPGHECIKSIKEVNHLEVCVHRDCNEWTCQLSCWGEQYIRIPALVACLPSNRVVNSSPIGVPVNKKLPFFCHGAQQLLVLLGVDFWLAASSSCHICSPPTIFLNSFLHCGFCVRNNWASLQPANQMKIKIMNWACFS